MELSNWVAGHLTGGLGNRLFQHAAAAGLAEKWKYPLVFCIPECEPTNHGPFDTIFKLFPSIPQVNEVKEVQRLPEPNGAVFTYCPLPESPTSSFVSIDGWRQTDMYFPKEGIRANFDSALSFERRHTLLSQFNLLGDQRYQTWFLHVRLGDYKILPHHQIDINSYYSNAVKHIPKGAKVLLFCDELREYGRFLQEYFAKLGLNIQDADVPHELEALYLMSQCKGGAIVANSTFSWWGAYFARESHREPSAYIATYPDVWGKGLPKAHDIVPSWGLRIQNQ